MAIGIPAAMLISSLVAAGGSAAAAKFGKQKQTTTPQFTPEQAGLQPEIATALRRKLQSPGSGLDMGGTKNRLRAATNRSYDNLGTRLEEAHANRGFGRSGSAGSSRRGVEIERANKLSDLEAQIEEFLQRLDLQEKNTTLEQAIRFSQPQGSQTVTNPGAAGAIGQGTGDLGFLLMLSQLMRQGGGGTPQIGQGGG